MKDYENFEGPSDEELTGAYRAFNQKRAAEQAKCSGGMQSSGQKYIGTPRNAKRPQMYGPVRIK